MIFKAKSNKGNISVEDKSLKDMENITGQKTSSSGYVLLDGVNGVYLPNNIEDLQGILCALEKTANQIKSLAQVTSGISFSTSTAKVVTDASSLISEINTQKNNLS